MLSPIRTRVWNEGLMPGESRQAFSCVMLVPGCCLKMGSLQPAAILPFIAPIISASPKTHKQTLKDASLLSLLRRLPSPGSPQHARMLERQQSARSLCLRCTEMKSLWAKRGVFYDPGSQSVEVRKLEPGEQCTCCVGFLSAEVSVVPR